MKNKPAPTDKLPTVTKRGSKAEQQKAFNQLGWKIQELVGHQSTLVKANNNKINGQNLDEIRLKTYDQLLPEIISAFEELAQLMLVPQAGGRPLNEQYKLASDLLEKHYIATKKVMKAPALVKALNSHKFGKDSAPDKDGYELMSERAIRDCIKYFRICLPHEDFYSN